MTNRPPINPDILQRIYAQDNDSAEDGICSMQPSISEIVIGLIIAAAIGFAMVAS